MPAVYCSRAPCPYCELVRQSVLYAQLMHQTVRKSLVGSVLLGLCGACASAPNTSPYAQFVTATPAEAAQSIARCEAARVDGDGLLGALATRGSLKVRVLAVRALGRLAGHEAPSRVVDALTVAAGDAEPRVRAEAAFALGLHAQTTAACKLASDPEASVRARAIEALSKTSDRRAYVAVLQALDDPDARVRWEAALGAGRWDKRAEHYTEFVQAFSQRAQQVSVDDTELLWRVLSTHARLKLSSLQDLCVRATRSPDVRVRIFAFQGLAQRPQDTETLLTERAEALRRGLRDTDARVAQEAALALRTTPEPELWADLAQAATASSTSTRLCAIEALGALGALDASLTGVFNALERARLDDSPNVRGARLEALAKALGAEAAPQLDLVRLDKDPIVRAAVARAAVHLGPERGVPLLDELSRDPHLRVATTATELLGTWDVPAARDAALRRLDSNDDGVRLAAMNALGTLATAEMAPRILAAVRTQTSGIGAEVAQVAVEIARRLRNARLALELSQHPNDYVAQAATQLLRTEFRKEPVARTEREVWRGMPGALNQPKGARITTTRGQVEVELYGAETPLHVHNFALHVIKGTYADLLFHRVVPDFVVQGGDPRGDGNGGAAWDGGALRAEFTPRPFVTGSLGMPRNADPDSGGCQVFFTLRETPHLDGRYTNFGTVTKGLEVLQRIEVGDRIVKVELLP